MFARVRAILHSTASRDSVRIDLTLARLAFVAIACLVLLPATQAGGAPLIGPLILRGLFASSVFLVVFLAVRLGGDSVGDVDCGMLELMFLSDMRPGQWLLVRIAQMWIGFLSVWIFRAPLLMLVFSLGGVRIEALLVSELLLMTGFLFLSSLALLFSFRAKSRRQVYGRIMAVVIVWELLLMAPGILTSLFRQYYGWSVPPETITVARMIGNQGLASRFRLAFIQPLQWADVGQTLIMYAGLSALILARFHRLLSLYACGTAVAVSASEQLPKQGRQRDSRRCWDDALAWQAFTIHGGGRRLVLGKCVGYLCLASAMWYLAERGYGESAFVISVAIASGVMIMSANKAGDCLSREIKERTITMLLLTPNGPGDFYAGWQRGALRLAWPDSLLWVGVTLASWTMNSMAPPIMITIGVAILASSPFLMLSPLVPFSVRGITTGVALIAGLIVILIVTVAFGVSMSPLAVPVVAVPMTVVYSQLLRRLLLPYWMRQKIESVL